MRRCPKLFLAGCTSAEPVSASFRQNRKKESKKERRNGMGYRP
jgi:hypothetical protein